jgi:hypothetical protein
MAVTASGLAKAGELALVARRRSPHGGMVAAVPAVLGFSGQNLSESKLG